MAATAASNAKSQTTLKIADQEAAKPAMKELHLNVPLKVAHGLGIAAVLTGMSESEIAATLIVAGLPKLAKLQPYIGVEGFSKGDVHSIIFDIDRS